MRPVCLFMLFSTVYTTIPHNCIKDKRIDLIESTYKRKGYPHLACNDRKTFLLWKTLQNIMLGPLLGLVKMYVMR